ncbi:LysR family transcriptional regulator [Comamonas piscis]|uniref:LysR family transcriptional regulator n=1 Tax=Comamonas piscis TaxID=1562974 RepID=A0A7G5EPC4_9BURK|nr:LysR substrate-binding domain-containing protein [Comamonas piscis]QMV75849.1 LysR family transcriptional regulator [Comamonas piscis]WSO36388.1 LysR substrate-binding domain-containing protein [Comamonas piscis]
MTASIQPADLGFFSVLAGAGSLSAAARELGITTPAVSKHLALMESRLNTALVIRTTRRMSLTPEGEVYLAHARRILGEIDNMEHLLSHEKASPKGLLRVSATLGFGRTHISPLISKFVCQHPQVDVQLQLSVNPPALTDDSFDVCFRFGPPPDARVIAKRLAANRRLLSASPAYLAAHGTPKVPQDLKEHSCIGIRQGEEAYGVWKLTRGRGSSATLNTIKTQGNLSTNDGDTAVAWALDGHGILMRAEWDIERYLRSGRLVQVLPQWHTPDADIYVVYPQRHQMAMRVRAFVDYVTEAFQR